MTRWTNGTAYSIATTAYDGLRTTNTPPAPANGSTVTDVDALGETTAVTDYTGPNASGTVLATTTYAYDAATRLIQVNDGVGHLTTQSWDQGDRRRTASDPDLGASSYAYDNADRLTDQTDGNGTHLTFSYDNLNRRTSEDVYQGANIGTWAYDPAGHRGQVATTKRPTDTGFCQDR